MTEAATSGKIDYLRGLKENVIIGRLIPTGERARMRVSEIPARDAVEVNEVEVKNEEEVIKKGKSELKKEQAEVEEAVAVSEAVEENPEISKELVEENKPSEQELTAEKSE